MPSVLGAARSGIRYLVRAASPEWEALMVDYYALRESPRRRGDFRWRPLRRCPDRRLDAAGAAIGHRLFVFGGFVSHDHVLGVVDILDMRARRWAGRWPLPVTMAQSHVAMASDGERHVYAVSGQLGNHCRPPTRSAFALDTRTGDWRDLPPLPEARYAAASALWRGRLHVFGGSREDRFTPAADHWSLAVSDGRAVEAGWRTEPPVPRGGPHRAAAVLGDCLYVFGGQVGDWIPDPNDPECRCVPPAVSETHYPDVFRLEPGGSAWVAVAPMPIAVSHTEGSVLRRDGTVYLFGGQCASSPGRGGTALSDVVQRYDPAADRWTVVGTLPYRSKTSVIGHDAGWVYMVAGQRDRGRDDAAPGQYVSQCWRARLR